MCEVGSSEEGEKGEEEEGEEGEGIWFLTSNSIRGVIDALSGRRSAGVCIFVSFVLLLLILLLLSTLILFLLRSRLGLIGRGDGLAIGVLSCLCRRVLESIRLVVSLLCGILGGDRRRRDDRRVVPIPSSL